VETALLLISSCSIDVDPWKLFLVPCEQGLKNTVQVASNGDELQVASDGATLADRA
jgi:hypothetical protein